MASSEYREPLSLALSQLDWLVCAAVLFGSLLVGLTIAVLKRRETTSDSFFLAGRTLLWPVVGASLYATNIGAEHLVGLSGDAYRYGLKAGTVELTTAICLGFACAVLFPYYIRTRVFTIPEFLELRYNAAARLFFSGLMLVICIMTKMAFTLYAGALVLHSLMGWDVMQVVLVLGVLAAVVTTIGGFAAVAYTDTIQAAIIIFGSALMTLIGLHQVGGWSGLSAAVPEHIHIAGTYDDPNYPFWGIIAGAVYGGIFYWGIDQVNVQRALGARDLDQARWGAMFAVLLKLTPVFIFALPGVIAYAVYPDLSQQQSKETFVWLLNHLCPSGVRGLVLAALLAAMISSLLAMMNSISTMAVRDFIVRVRPRTAELTQVRLGRIAIAIATVLGVAAAWLIYKTPGGLYKYLQTISIYLVMPITPAIAFGILSRRINMAGAVASVLVGAGISTVYVADELIGPEVGQQWFPWLHHTLTLNYTYRGLWGTLAIVAVLFGVSWMTPPSPTEKLARTTIRWRDLSEPFRGLRDWRLHGALLAAVTVALYYWLW
jgi:SSS family solute:Na+ symporter